MTFLAIRGKSGFFMVWLSGGLKVLKVAIHTLVPQSFKLQGRSRLVTLVAVHFLVYSL